MKYVWSEANRLNKLIETEAALAMAEADIGLVPKEAAGNIAKSIESVELKRVKAIEDEINHDMMAVVIGITEQCTK